MKKYLYITLAIVVFIIGFWILNKTGVITVKAWAEKMITSAPFLEEYVQTNQAYQELSNQYDINREGFARLQEEHKNLERELENARKIVEDQKGMIEKLEGELASLQEKKYTVEERLNKLVKIYSAMKPDEAARIFTSLDEQLVLEILLELKDEQAARILAALSPAAAAEYSTAIKNN